MSEQEQLPVCALCGEHPKYNGRMVGCSRPTCSVRGALMNASDWRRLMARPRLALEQVEAIVALNDRLFDAGSVPTVGGQTVGYEIMHVILTGQERCTWMAAIRAALAALGEE